jgi:hypothetical protein
LPLRDTSHTLPNTLQINKHTKQLNKAYIYIYQ